MSYTPQLIASWDDLKKVMDTPEMRDKFLYDCGKRYTPGTKEWVLKQIFDTFVEADIYPEDILELKGVKFIFVNTGGEELTAWNKAIREQLEELEIEFVKDY